MQKALMYIKGLDGHVELFPDGVYIHRKGMLAFLVFGRNAGKMFSFDRISQVDYRKPTAAINGYIQFVPEGEIKAEIKANISHENAVMFNMFQDAKFVELKGEVEARIGEKTQTAPDSSLLTYLRGAVAEISAPLDAYLDHIESTTGKRHVKGSGDLIINDIIVLTLPLAGVDGNASLEEAALVKKMVEGIDPSRDFLPQAYQQVMSTWDQGKGLSKPAAVLTLEEYDQACGTAYAEKAKALFFRLANAITKADGTVTPEEIKFLDEYRRILYEPSDERANTVEDGFHGSPVIDDQSQPAETADNLLSELNSLVGLDSVKADVAQLVNFIKVQQMRKDRGMSAVPISRHLVFYGNPGTGKTTVARLLAKIYKSLGIVTKGHFVETDRSGLVAGYVGHTAIKVKETVTSALGGVLFIDEAYALTGEGNDFGREAIDTLIKLMEDNRDDLIVIVAGYTDKMREFLAMNPGLKSRFNKYFSFEDYAPSQLVAIFQSFCTGSDFVLSRKALEKAAVVFQILSDVKDETFGNGRLARNIFERTLNNQANRVIAMPSITEDTLSMIEDIDIPGAVEFHGIGTM